MQSASISLKQAEKNWADYERCRVTRVRAPPQRQRSNVIRYLSQCAGGADPTVRCRQNHEFFDQPTQGYQDGFEKQYVVTWNKTIGSMISPSAITMPPQPGDVDSGGRDDRRTGGHLRVWFGIKASLVAPMNRLIDSIVILQAAIW